MREIPFRMENPQRVTEEDIRILEERFHFKMPDDMRQFYLTHNGGLLPYETEQNPEWSRLSDFLSIKHRIMKYIPTMDNLLEWQERDGFIPMYLIPFCVDEADDFYYIRVDEEGYGKVYYIFSEFLDDFLANPEGEWLIAGSFSEFLEKIHFTQEQS